MTAVSTADRMVVAMTRLLRDGEVVFQGVNSVLPMIAINLARRLHAPHLVYLNVGGGIDPAPRYMPESSTDAELAYASAALFSNEDFYDLCARGGMDTAFLGFVQMDAEGRTNTSAIGPHARPKVRLPGGGGAAMIMPTARRVLLWRTQHSPRVFVPQLDFVTAVGNVDRVVTPLCIFQRRAGRLQVEGRFAGVADDEIRRQTGFPLLAATAWPELPEPTDAELTALHTLDPTGVRYREFRG